MEEWLKIRKRSGRGVDEKNLEEERRKSSGRARREEVGVSPMSAWSISMANSPRFFITRDSSSRFPPHKNQVFYEVHDRVKVIICFKQGGEEKHRAFNIATDRGNSTAGSAEVQSSWIYVNR